LRDACTLEAYLALIDGAESHVNAVNGFPVVLELQHALIRAVRRGVRVRSLVGNLTPTHGDTHFKGPWSGPRAAATEFVHSRLDPIVAAGGEGYVFAVPQQPQWAPGLGVIHPHVHAKLITVDGKICTVGSANLDLTAGYWEDELILVVEDRSVAQQVEDRVARLIAQSVRIDRADPAWQQRARQRGWWRRWPGVLSV
jgi:phosphatidylserine/phosphatidylglycerophosphate/cardiolipin synthase-like enzyme